MWPRTRPSSAASSGTWWWRTSPRPGASPRDELIRRLRVKDLVVQRRPSALAEAAEYGFRHVLIRDVAYDSLPKRDRSRLHRDIAGWAELELADRIEEFAELIAGHLSAALAYEEEFALDDDEDLRLLRGLTKRAALRAARRAAAISQLAAAGRWLKLAVDLARKLQVPPREMADLAREYADVAWENADARERDAVLATAIDGLQALPDRTAADTQLLAGLRGQRGQALYEAGEADAARDLLLAAIADLEPGPPTAARAALLDRLGWTFWRAGRVQEAVPILERAIAEATACSHGPTLRWATHNLGAALAFLERQDEAVTLLEESFRQAREADDRGLLLRCYINLPAVRYGRGDPVAPLIDMLDEGLRMARRSAATHSLAWLAGNRAEFSRELGRLDEALAHADEAVHNAPVISPSHWSARLLSRALIHRYRGEVEDAALDVDAAERIGGDHEPQVAALHPLNVALERWSDDAPAAAAALADWVTGRRSDPTRRCIAVHELARMALRLGGSGAAGACRGGAPSFARQPALDRAGGPRHLDRRPCRERPGGRRSCCRRLRAGGLPDLVRGRLGRCRDHRRTDRSGLVRTASRRRALPRDGRAPPARGPPGDRPTTGPRERRGRRDCRHRGRRHGAGPDTSVTPDAGCDPGSEGLHAGVRALNAGGVRHQHAAATRPGGRLASDGRPADDLAEFDHELVSQARDRRALVEVGAVDEVEAQLAAVDLRRDRDGVVADPLRAVGLSDGSAPWRTWRFAGLRRARRAGRGG